MSRRIIFATIAALAIAGAVLMYQASHGEGSGTYMRSFWWITLPLAFVSLMTALAPSHRKK